MRRDRVRATAALLSLAAALAAAPSAAKRPPRQDPNAAAASAQQQAQAAADALVRGEFLLVADSTWPAVMDKLGGRAAFLSLLEKNARNAQDNQFKLASAVVGKPGRIVKTGLGEWHCVLEQVLTIDSPGGRQTARNALVGVSKDEGKTWRFIDAGAMRPEQLRVVLPNWTGELPLPPPDGTVPQPPKKKPAE